MIHCVEKNKNQRKRRHDNGGHLQSLIFSDDLGGLLGALDNNRGGAVGDNVSAL